uniref:Transposon MuDR mudrA n=1 Tax=Solanum tuberosum TaxID=4113 RepID=M1DYD3_SOLTU
MHRSVSNRRQLTEEQRTRQRTLRTFASTIPVAEGPVVFRGTQVEIRRSTESSSGYCSGTTDRVLHCAPLKSSLPTNIDLDYKPNGLRWKSGAAVTQRQLQEQSYKRATQSTPSTQDI